MDVPPGARGTARLWQHTEEALAAIAVWTERIAGKGEDADPLVLLHRPTRSGLLAVFDGVGGAGRAPAGQTPSGQLRTQAWLASRRARALVEEWFVDTTAGVAPHVLATHLAHRLGTGVLPQRRIRGKLQRELPTTFAGLLFELAGGQVTWQVMWAGDSRCYVAEPRGGLQQLSLDDTEPGDALELLLQDPPMTNLVQASGPFQIHGSLGAAGLPCLLITATDGFFGYVGTPAEFEYALWETLLSAQDAMHWSVLLTEKVQSYTQDDASIAIVALGFEDFPAVRASFRARFDRLREEHAEPMRRATASGRTALVETRKRSWLAYREHYERRLPPREGSGS
ncbi:serine/threonine protein phosphatase [Amycolatopsis sp. NPDC054798]